MVEIVLEGILNILGHGRSLEGEENPFAVTLESLGGLNKVEALQNHPSHKVYELTLKIIEEFFAFEEEANRDE